MSHASAALTPRARLRLARLIVDEDWSVAATLNLNKARYHLGEIFGESSRTAG